MPEHHHKGISEEARDRLKSLSIRSVVELMGALPVRKRYICYGGHDTNPSLSISEQKGLYHCFGCGQGGDVIKLVMNAKKIGYVDACRLLMQEYGIDDHGIADNRYRPKKRKPPVPDPQPELLEQANSNNFKIYEWLIKRLTLSAEGLRYLVEQRGFTEAQVRDLEIRDMPSPQRSKPMLLAHFDEERLLASGLCKKDENGFHMVWRDHVIIFPYVNQNLRIVNLQARRIAGGEPKYIFLNGVGPSLYNLSILNEMDRGDRLLLCEGVPDTITALQLEFNAIGVPGAHNFKPEFVDLLMDYDIYVVPDSDKGGQQFVNNVKGAFKLRGKAIKEFKVPDGNKDLNEYFVRKNRGPQ